MEEIRRSIDSITHESPPPEPRKFVCPNALHNSLERDVISRAIESTRIPKKDRHFIVDDIMRYGIQTFATLIEINRPDTIGIFIRKEKTNILLQEPEVKDIFSNDLEGLELEDTTKAFYEAQWKFYPYEFKATKVSNFREIPEEMILPFTSREVVGMGRYGDVDKMEVLSSLQDFMKADRVAVVRKKLRASHNVEIRKAARARNEMLREMEALRELNLQSNENIVRLLSAYLHQGFYNFLFPVLDMNLETFFSLEDPWGGERTAYYTALQGLASAFQTMHGGDPPKRDQFDLQFIYYHGDIWPENILVDLKRKKFLIADFGVVTAFDKSGVQDTLPKWEWSTLVGPGGDNLAPECRDGKSIGRPTDIWSLGCVLLEVVVYRQLQKDGVEDFRNQRFKERGTTMENFIDQFFFAAGGKTLKRAVITMFEKLESSDPEILELMKHMLEPIPKDRWNANRVHSRMSFISVQSLCHEVLKKLDTYQGAKDLVEIIKAWIAAFEADYRDSHPIPETYSILLKILDQFSPQELSKDPGESSVSLRKLVDDLCRA